MACKRIEVGREGVCLELQRGQEKEKKNVKIY